MRVKFSQVFVYLTLMLSMIFLHQKVYVNSTLNRFMNFTGALDYRGETEGESPQLGISSEIIDARLLYSLAPNADAYDQLPNNRGFLLTDSPSAVVGWSDAQEVARLH